MQLSISRKATALLFSALLPVTAVADIYVYTDANGRKHYSDKPHPEGDRYQPAAIIQPVPKPSLPKIGSSTPQKAKFSNKKKTDKALAKQQKRCASLDKKIDRLTDKLRQGHSNKQGNKWRKQRREYSDQRYRECR